MPPALQWHAVSLRWVTRPYCSGGDRSIRTVSMLAPTPSPTIMNVFAQGAYHSNSRRAGPALDSSGVACCSQVAMSA